MLSHHFQLLKKLVLTVSGLSKLSPSGCKILSGHIFQKTKMKISETTLKRIYGFANSEFKPSQFTIETLLCYCGYTNWSSFLQDHDQRAIPAKTFNWLSLHDQASKITGFTSRALKGRSGIPFVKTSRRAFVDEHFKGLLQSGTIATVITAPASYGKTIALLHWIDDKQERDAVNGLKDILLLFNTSTFQSVLMSGQNFHAWLLGLLGFNHSDELMSVLNDKERETAIFYLIIDGFDEHAFKDEQFLLILSYINNILSIYELSDSFRLVLTMRHDTWNNYRHLFDVDENKWFMGPDTRNDQYINVPLLNLQEIQEVNQKITHQAKSCVNPVIVKLLSHPLYLQYYYKLHKDDFSLNYASALLRYDLVSALLLDKIFYDKHAAERMAFLFELLQIMSAKDGLYHIKKINATAIVNKHQRIYQEMIVQGFLIELNINEDLLSDARIKFGSYEILEYTLAHKLLTANNNYLNQELVFQVNLITTEDVKLNVIKWIIIYALKNGQQACLHHIVKAELALNQKARLLQFLGDAFEKELFNNAGNCVFANQLFKMNDDDKLFNYFLGLNFIDAAYEKTLQMLLRFNLPDDKKLMVLCSLAITATIKLDLKALESYLSAIKKIAPAELYKFAINPVKCIDAIFHNLKYGIIKKDAFAEITRFCFNPPGKGEWFDDSIENDMVFILASFTLQFTSNPAKQIRFIKLLQSNYKDLSTQHSEYSFFLNMAAADAYFKQEDKAGLAICSQIVQKLYPQGESCNFTPIMQAMVCALNIKIALINKQYDEVITVYKQLNTVTSTHKLRLIKLYVITFIIKNTEYTDCIANEQFYRQLHHEQTKLTIEGAVVELLEKQVAS